MLFFSNSNPSQEAKQQNEEKTEIQLKEYKENEIVGMKL